MNTECVYYSKKKDFDFDTLASEIFDCKYGDLYPISYAEVTRDVEIFKDYEQNQSMGVLKKGTKCIFVKGKLCDMHKIGHAIACFPDWDAGNWFVDLKFYEKEA